ncbi:hypothetical protein OL67_002656 [Phaeobacter piscinae]|nr:hypothetical protein OL67_002656 [Phaeobacter piscinae]
MLRILRMMVAKDSFIAFYLAATCSVRTIRRPLFDGLRIAETDKRVALKPTSCSHLPCPARHTFCGPVHRQKVACHDAVQARLTQHK